MNFIQMISDFDCFTSFWKVSNFYRESNSQKIKSIHKLITIYLCFTIIKTTVVLFTISEDQHSLLLIYGELSTVIANRDIRLRVMISSTAILYCLLILLLFIHYNNYENNWISRISEIYEQIKTQSMDRKLKSIANDLNKIHKYFCSLLMFTVFIFLTAIYLKNFNLNLVYIYHYFESLFLALFGYSLIFRSIFIILFLIQKYILIFNEINTQITNDFYSMNSNNLNSFLINHYKNCDSLKIANKFIKTNFILLLASFSPMISYCLVYFIFAKINDTLIVMAEMIIFNYFTLILILSVYISFIDVEAKKALHAIHGFSFIVSDGNMIFQVC